MNQNSKRILILLLDAICGVALALFFSDMLTSTSAKVIACCTWIGVFIFRIILDCIVITPEETYYKKSQEQLQNSMEYKIKMQNEIHKKMLLALRNDDLSGVVTLKQIDERFGVK